MSIRRPNVVKQNIRLQCLNGAIRNFTLRIISPPTWNDLSLYYETPEPPKLNSPPPLFSSPIKY